MTEQSRAQPRCCSLRLLGRWQLVADGEDIGLSHREQRLTALLGLTGRSSRLHVAGLLWPDSTDDRALASLRRAVLQTQKRCPGLLQADRLSIGLDPGVDVDLDELKRAATSTEDAIPEGEAGALLGALVAEELLPGWYDEWVVPERERLEQLRLKALERIARQALDSHDLMLCVDAARAAAAASPLLESAAELTIRAHLGRGDLGSALLEYDRYRHAVWEELGVPPSRAILGLIEPALEESRNATDIEEEDTPVAPARSRPVPEAPTVLVDGPDGEEPEVAAPARLEDAPSAVDADLPGGELSEFAALLGPEAATSAVRRVVTIPGPPRGAVRSVGGRGAVLRLVGVVALLLVASLAVLAVGLTPTGGTSGGGDTGAAARRQAEALPADHGIHPSTMLVRLVDAAAGRAAFLVRTETQPALVRLEVRGHAGRNIVRDVMVRSPEGRRLKVSGLRPGTYRWLATSSVASAVSGRLRIPDQAVVVPVDAQPSADAGTTVEAAAGPTAAAPTDQPPADSAADPTAPASPAPQSSSDTSQPGPSPSPRPHLGGQPKDPGTRPVTPVG